jgi:hypothetical protein
MKKIFLLLLAFIGLTALSHLKECPAVRHTRHGIPDPDAPYPDWSFDAW